MRTGKLKAAVVATLLAQPDATLLDFLAVPVLNAANTFRYENARIRRGFHTPLSRPTDDILYRLRVAGYAERREMRRIGYYWYRVWRLTPAGRVWAEKYLA